MTFPLPLSARRPPLRLAACLIAAASLAAPGFVIVTIAAQAKNARR